MEHKKRIITVTAILLLITLMVTTTIPVFAYDSQDPAPQRKPDVISYADTAGTWCDKYVNTCYEAGLMEGASTTQFKPKEILTNAQVIVTSDRLLHLLRGGDGKLDAAQEGEKWYQPAYQELVAEGVLSGADDYRSNLPQFEDAKANSASSRDYFVKVLYAVLEAANVSLTNRNQIASIPDVSNTTDGGAPAILAFYNAGILNGKDKYGSFDGASLLSREQAAAILARLVEPSLRLTFLPESFDLCRDVLQLPPDTVLFYADGEPVTAELFGSTLINSLLQWGKDTTREAGDDAVQIWVKYSASYFALAKIVGVSISDDQFADAQRSAKAGAGYLGSSEASRLYMQCKIKLGMQLEQYYIEHYDQKSAEYTYHSALSDCASRMTVEITSAFRTLDLNAVFARANHSPFSYSHA